MDLEWSNAYVASEKRLMNVAISVGAVKTDEQFNIIDRFSAYIKPGRGFRLRKDVKNLTGITEEQLSNGISFSDTVKTLCRFVDEEDTLLFWGGSDMAVLDENCRVFLGLDRVPFVNRYIDMLKACDEKLEIPGNHQLSLADTAKLLQVDIDGLSAHDAFDDSIMALKCFKKLFINEDTSRYVIECDSEYYARKRFRKYKISDCNDPRLKGDLVMVRCPSCRATLQRTEKLHSNGCNMFARHHCPSCGEDFFVGMVFTVTYDGVKRHISIRPWKNAVKNDE